MNSIFPETADIHSSSDEYARRFAGEIGAFFLERQEQSVMTLITGQEIKTVLDVGGGHAQIALPLAKCGFAVTVLGSNQSCSSRLKTELNQDNLSFQVANLVELPFADASFEGVISLRFLSHCDNWPQLIKELCRVGSKLVIVDYPPLCSFNFLTPLLFKLKRGIEGNTREYTIFTHKQVAAEFSKYGFKLQRKIPQFFIPMGIHRALKSPRFSRVAERICRLCGATQLFGSPTIAAFAPQK